MRYSENDKTKMLEQYENGMTFRDISKMFGCSEQTVLYHVHKLQGRKKQKGGVVSETLDIPPKKVEPVQKEARLLLIGNAKVLGSLKLNDVVYKIDSIEQTIQMSRNGEEVTIKLSEIEQFIEDLNAILEHKEEFDRKIQVEAW